MSDRELDVGVVAIGSDHAAYEAKEQLKTWLAAHGIKVQDFGTHSTDSMDYPDVARPLCEAVVSQKVSRGVLMCGTGLGMCYVANRMTGVRAAPCWSIETAELSRLHNDANVLILPGRAGTMDSLEEILEVWLKTPFTGDERHQRRIDKIDSRQQV